jgi:hypothetical protein
MPAADTAADGGSREAPDIRDYLNPIRRQDGKEVGEGARRMPHRPHTQGRVQMYEIAACS